MRKYLIVNKTLTGKFQQMILYVISHFSFTDICWGISAKHTLRWIPFTQISVCSPLGGFFLEYMAQFSSFCTHTKQFCNYGRKISDCRERCAAYCFFSSPRSTPKFKTNIDKSVTGGSAACREIPAVLTSVIYALNSPAWIHWVRKKRRKKKNILPRGKSTGISSCKTSEG